MTDLAAIKARVEALTIDPRFSAHYLYGFEKCRTAVLALLADTPSVEPRESAGAEAALARLRRDAATDWHDSTRIKVTAGDLRAVLALLPTQASDSPEKP